MRRIVLIGGADDQLATFTPAQENGLCRVTCKYSDKIISSEAHDYFEALCGVRLELEEEGLIPLCYGASINVFPSSMARQMSKGISAYRTEMGKQATRESIVCIFETGADVVPSSVSHQKQYFNDWLASLKDPC